MQEGQLLMVPEKKKKHKNHSLSGERSLSPASPMEIKINQSGDFSDFLDSDDYSSKGKTTKGGSSSKARKSTLPDIEENKSLQVKNSG